MKFKTNLDSFNIIATLLLGFAALIISINSYRLTERQTYLIERQNILEEGQLKLELKNAILEAMNIAGYLSQTEKDYPNIKNCIDGFKELKSILNRQLENKILFENKELSQEWTELSMNVNFSIKLFQEGLRENLTIAGAHNKVLEIDSKTKKLFKLLND